MTDGGDTPEAGSSEESEDVTGVRECAACGTRFNAAAWHPVATRIDDDGEFHLYAFCSTECRDAWRDD